jgi:hypothetical protein
MDTTYPLLNSSEMLQMASQIDFFDLGLKGMKMKAEGIEARLDKNIQDLKYVQGLLRESTQMRGTARMVFGDTTFMSAQEIAPVGNDFFLKPPTKNAGDDALFEIESDLYKRFHAK